MEDTKVITILQYKWVVWYLLPNPCKAKCPATHLQRFFISQSSGKNRKSYGFKGRVSPLLRTLSALWRQQLKLRAVNIWPFKCFCLLYVIYLTKWRGAQPSLKTGDLEFLIWTRFSKPGLDTKMKKGLLSNGKHGTGADHTYSWVQVGWKTHRQFNGITNPKPDEEGKTNIVTRQPLTTVLCKTGFGR